MGYDPNDIYYDGFRRQTSSRGVARLPRTWVVQETVVKVSLPTSGNNNPEVGMEALTRLVREMQEEVFKARIKAYGETLQAKRLECSTKRDSPLKQEPRSVKGVKTRPNFLTCECCKRRHLGEC
ncbi:hypothetical protein PVK06_011751 [Gossypium arboreum]|uniref:Uncharacterized protein n=1 Tax=Gossypium arboreum TaxID=29729 RepID=A0ABR0QAF7_GOSAR|nr:hypothetical protein PVK06_011751 [Gossypium arboreum]